MISTRDRDSLFLVLDAPPVETLMALADWHEEDGQVDVAAGFRWLARNGKQPIRDIDHRWGWVSESRYKSCQLPRRAIKLVTGLAKRTPNSGRALSRSMAYMDAAIAIGTSLRECAQTGTFLLECPRCKQGQNEELHDHGCCDKCFLDGWRSVMNTGEWVKHIGPRTDTAGGLDASTSSL